VHSPTVYQFLSIYVFKVLILFSEAGCVEKGSKIRSKNVCSPWKNSRLHHTCQL